MRSPRSGSRLRSGAPRRSTRRSSDRTRDPCR
jgi:hypothetical protein